MVRLESFLKKCDFFGSKFYFSQNGDKKFTTFFGGLLSISCLIISANFVFFFGSDFFFRTNPQIVQQQVLSRTYYSTKLTTKDFLIPFAIEDFTGALVNFTGIIYPVLTFIYTKQDENKNYYTARKVQMELTPCNTSYNYLIPNINLSNYYCPDWDNGDYSIGGNWDGPFIYTFGISIHYCPNGAPYSKAGNCTSLDVLDSIFQSQQNWFLTLFYPIWFFDPNNLLNPLKVDFKNYYQTLNVGLTKYDVFNFNKVVLNDDQGWIMKSNVTSLLYAYENTDSQYYIFPRNNYYNEGQSSMIYKSYYYLDKNYQLFQRRFMKLQELAAIVGGFMKIITTVCQYLAMYFSSSKQKEFFFSEFFNYYKEDENSKIQDISKFKPSNNNSYYSQSKIENRSFDLEISHIQKQVPKTNNETSPQNELFPFGLWFMFKYSFCKSTLIPSNESKIKIYEICLNYFNQRSDIILYFKTLQQFDTVKTSLFNAEQLIHLESKKKHNLMNQDELNFIQEIININNKTTLKKNDKRNEKCDSVHPNNQMIESYLKRFSMMLKVQK